MPFFIPIAAVIGKGIAAAAGAGIGGTAISMAWNLKDRMKHTTTVVAELMNLSEGDHISVKVKGTLPFQHAIVVEAVGDPKDKVKVVYHSGSGASARVEFAEVDLHGHARVGELYQHHSEPLICYSGEAVVARAMSLCSQYNTADRREVLRNYWPFFRSDYHFANWCQIGFCFSDGIKAAVMTGYTQTLVSDVACLIDGDHIVTSDGLSGIVVEVAEDGSQVEVIRFPVEDQRGPGRVVIKDFTRHLLVTFCLSAPCTSTLTYLLTYLLNTELLLY